MINKFLKNLGSKFPFSFPTELVNLAYTVWDWPTEIWSSRTIENLENDDDTNMYDAMVPVLEKKDYAIRGVYGPKESLLRLVVYARRLLKVILTYPNLFIETLSAQAKTLSNNKYLEDIANNEVEYADTLKAALDAPPEQRSFKPRISTSNEFLRFDMTPFIGLLGSALKFEYMVYLSKGDLEAAKVYEDMHKCLQYLPYYLPLIFIGTNFVPIPSKYGQLDSEPTMIFDFFFVSHAQALYNQAGYVTLQQKIKDQFLERGYTEFFKVEGLLRESLENYLETEE